MPHASGMGQPPVQKLVATIRFAPQGANRPSSPSPAPLAQCHFAATGGHRPPLGSPFGGAGERSASLRGRLQWQIWKMYRDCCMVPSQSWHQCANLQLPAPSQSRLSAVPALPEGEPRGGCAAQSRPPPAIEPGDPQRCGSTARVADSNCQRVQPALSVTAFSRASSPYGRAKGGCAADNAPSNIFDGFFSVYTK